LAREAALLSLWKRGAATRGNRLDSFAVSSSMLMIRHLALFTLNPEISDVERDALMERIRGFRRLKSVRKIELSRLLKPREPWYVPRMSADFEWLLMIEFENEDKLYEFQTDRYHLEVGGDLRRNATAVRIMDFSAG